MKIKQIIEEVMRSGVLTAEQSHQINFLLQQGHPNTSDWESINKLTDALLNGSVIPHMQTYMAA